MRRLIGWCKRLLIVCFFALPSEERRQHQTLKQQQKICVITYTTGVLWLRSWMKYRKLCKNCYIFDDASCRCVLDSRNISLKINFNIFWEDKFFAALCWYMCVSVCFNWESLNGYQWLLEQQQQQHHRKINWFMSSRRRDVIIFAMFCQCFCLCRREGRKQKYKPPNPCNLMSFVDLHGKRAQHAKKSNLLYHSFRP